MRPVIRGGSDIVPFAGVRYRSGAWPVGARWGCCCRGHLGRGSSQFRGVIPRGPDHTSPSTILSVCAFAVDAVCPHAYEHFAHIHASAAHSCDGQARATVATLGPASMPIAAVSCELWFRIETNASRYLCSQVGALIGHCDSQCSGRWISIAKAGRRRIAVDCATHPCQIPNLHRVCVSEPWARKILK